MRKKITAILFMATLIICLLGNICNTVPASAAATGATITFDNTKADVKTTAANMEKDQGTYIVTYTMGNDKVYLLVTMKTAPSKLSKESILIESGKKTFKKFDYSGYVTSGKTGDYKSRYVLIKSISALHESNLYVFTSTGKQADIAIFLSSQSNVVKTIEKNVKSSSMMFNFQKANVNDDDLSSIDKGLQDIRNLSKVTKVSSSSFYNKSKKATNPYTAKNSSMSQTITAEPTQNYVTGSDLYTSTLLLGGKETVRLTLNFKAVLKTSAKNVTYCNTKESADAFFDGMTESGVSKRITIARNKNKHKDESRITVKDFSDCTKGGKVTIKCKDCGKIFEENVISPASHKFVDVAGTYKAPTCTTAGSKKQKCSVCGKEQTVEAGKALGHDIVGTIIQPTCTASGRMEGKCKRCGKEVNESIKPLGHNDDGRIVIGKAATCTSSGYQCTHCTRCNKELNKKTIHSLGHNDDKKVVVCKGPTCTRSGYKASHCTRCKKEMNKITLKSLGHEDDENYVMIKAPTCTKSGKSATHCLRCNKEMKHRTEKKLEHDWNDGVIERYATEKSSGRRKFTCKKCGKTKHETIPKGSSDQLTKINYENQAAQTAIKQAKAKKTAIKAVKYKNNRLILSLKKVSGIDGYEIQVTGTKKIKKITIDAKTTQKVALRKAVKGQTYSIKVRPYKKVRGKKYYGKWTKVKKKKI